MISNRKKVAEIFLTCKGRKFKITSAYLSLRSNSTIDRDKINNYNLQTNDLDFFNKNYYDLTQLLTYEISFGLLVKIYFDYQKFKKIFDVKVGNSDRLMLLFPYIMNMHICDSTNQYKEISLICDCLYFDEMGDILGINIENNSEGEFRLIQPFYFCRYEIFYIPEIDWKINEYNSKLRYGY